MVRDETKADTKTDKHHYTFTPQTVPADICGSSKVTHPSRYIVVYLRPWFCGTYDECRVTHLIPVNSLASCPLMICGNGKKYVFIGKQDSVAYLGLGFAGSNYCVETTMAQLHEQVIAISLSYKKVYSTVTK